eukprot:scaffold50097_cov33-Attheya_sp.AAC.3
MNFEPKNAWKAIKEIRDRFEGHHEAQSDLEIDPTVLDKIKQREVKRDLGDPSTVQEVKLALRKSADGKSPGESRITAEALKALNNELYCKTSC